MMINRKLLIIMKQVMGSPNYIFLESAKKFISKLKKSKQVIIEIEFFQNGEKQIKFNTDGLKWSH